MLKDNFVDHAQELVSVYEKNIERAFSQPELCMLTSQKIKSALKEIKKAYVLYLRFWVALKVCCSTSIGLVSSLVSNTLLVAAVPGNSSSTYKSMVASSSSVHIW